MSITLKSPPDVETQKEKNKAALLLLAQWDEEDANPDPQELAQREAEWQEFKAAMGDTHALSETALAKDWLRPEEDEAWQHL